MTGKQITAEDIRISLQKSLRWVVTATVVLYIITLSLAGYAWHEATISHDQAINAHVALCAFKEDLEGRVTSGNAYIKAHPEGIPSLHISAGVLRNSIISEQKTVNSLSTLNCG